MIKAFIFDMDGVIIDSEPLHFESDKKVLKDYNIEITHNELIDYVGVTNSQMWSELIEKYSLTAKLEELLEKQDIYKKHLFGEGELEAIAGIKELIDDLRKNGISIGLASSSSRDFIELILKNLKLYEAFDIIVSGEEVSNSKPSPDIFLKAAELLNVHPSQCMVLEDSGHGVKAAKSAGMKCIAYRNPNSGSQDLSLSDIVIDSIEKINWLNL